MPFAVPSADEDRCRLAPGMGRVCMKPLSGQLDDLGEAADGAIMFGVSTAMIFTVIVPLIQAKFEDLRN